MAVVELLLSPLASHVRTARLVSVTAARRAGLVDELVDELRLAVGEACSRAVGLHTRHGIEAPVRVRIEDGAAGLIVVVMDAGPPAGPLPDDVSAGIVDGGDLAAIGDDDLVDPDVALALLIGLVDTATVEPGPHGTTVTLRWPLPQPARGPGTSQVSRA
ncbi:MAG: ATP-binding protein [Frankiales bacterium]|nr:ATP-binding protein [Frankiales bacterium]